jgi:hypothetical protein
VTGGRAFPMRGLGRHARSMEAERNDGGAEAHGVLIKTMGGCTGATALHDCELSFLSRLVGGSIATSVPWRARLSLLQARGFLGKQILSSFTSIFS